MTLASKAVPIFALALLIASAAMLPVRAQDEYPNRPVRLIVPFAGGGSTDAVARVLAARLSEELGQQVVVEPRPGAAGAIGAQAVAKSPTDGYTLLLGTNSTHAVLPALSARLQYDLREFTSVTMVGRSPTVLSASPKLAANSVTKLIAYGKANPGALNFSSSGTGAVTHLIGEQFNLQAGIKAVHVPYKTGVQSVPDMMDGKIHYNFDTTVWSLPLIRAGQLKGLGIGSLQRSPIAPDLPTISEAGLPGFEGVIWFALFAPAGTPAPIVAKLNRHAIAALKAEDVLQRLAGLAVEATPSSPAEVDAIIRQDVAKWKDVSQQTGIRLD